MDLGERLRAARPDEVRTGNPRSAVPYVDRAILVIERAGTPSTTRGPGELGVCGRVGAVADCRITQ